MPGDRFKQIKPMKNATGFDLLHQIDFFIKLPDLPPSKSGFPNIID